MLVENHLAYNSNIIVVKKKKKSNIGKTNQVDQWVDSQSIISVSISSSWLPIHVNKKYYVFFKCLLKENFRWRFDLDLLSSKTNKYELS